MKELALFILLFLVFGCISDAKEPVREHYSTMTNPTIKAPEKISTSAPQVANAPGQFGKRICDVDGRMQFFGLDFIGEDILLKCRCDGDIKKVLGKNCAGCAWYECDGDIEYECLKMDVSKRQLPSVEPQDAFIDFIDSNSNTIDCPPNTWDQKNCIDDSLCGDMECKMGQDPVCTVSGCECVDNPLGWVSGSIVIPSEEAESFRALAKDQGVPTELMLPNEVTVYSKSVDEELMRLMEVPLTPVGAGDDDIVLYFRFWFNAPTDTYAILISPCTYKAFDFDPNNNSILELVYTDECANTGEDFADQIIGTAELSGILRTVIDPKTAGSYCARSPIHHALVFDNQSVILRFDKRLADYKDARVFLNSTVLLRKIKCCDGCSCPVGPDWKEGDEVPDFVCELHDVDVLLWDELLPTMCESKNAKDCINKTFIATGKAIKTLSEKYIVADLTMDKRLLESHLGTNVTVKGIVIMDADPDLDGRLALEKVVYVRKALS